MLDVVAGFVWLAYGILTLASIAFGLLVMMTNTDGAGILIIYSGIASTIFSSLMKLTEKMPIYGIIIFALLMIYLLLTLKSKGKEK